MRARYKMELETLGLALKNEGELMTPGMEEQSGGVPYLPTWKVRPVTTSPRIYKAHLFSFSLGLTTLLTILCRNPCLSPTVVRILVGLTQK